MSYILHSYVQNDAFYLGNVHLRAICWKCRVSSQSTVRPPAPEPWNSLKVFSGPGTLIFIADYCIDERSSGLFIRKTISGLRRSHHKGIYGMKSSWLHHFFKVTLMTMPRSKIQRSLKT